jgi:hypothetical protein
MDERGWMVDGSRSVSECGVQRFKWFFSAASPELLDLSSLSDESRHRSDEDVLKDTGAEMSLGSELGQSSSTYKKYMLIIIVIIIIIIIVIRSQPRFQNEK